jgi:hypothetical protein
MPIAVFLTLVLVTGWVLLDSRKTKDVIKLYFLIGVFAIWGTYLFIKLGDWSPIANRYIYLICIPIFIFLIIRVYKTGKRTVTDIAAKQQSYWGISSNAIYGYYKKRVMKKDDRIEIDIDPSTKYLTRKYSDGSVVFSGSIVYEISDIALTKIANIAEIKNIELYSLIFKKIENTLKYMEKNINFDDALKENDMCVEYFLLDLWEKFTKNFNLGVANLEVYAKTVTQKEFVGALDSVCLNSVKRNGALLLYMFLKFKNRLPNGNDNNQNNNSGE